jgi:hypothetical protein
VYACAGELKALWARREPLMQEREREKKRLQTVQAEAVRASLARMLAVLKDEIAPIEARVEELIASDADLSQKAALLQTAVGVVRVACIGGSGSGVGERGFASGACGTGDGRGVGVFACVFA